MSGRIPDAWSFVLIALAVFRLWRLLAEDSILDAARARMLGVPGWKPTGHETPPEGYRAELATFLTCPWCLGAHLSLAAYLLWLLTPWWTLTVSLPFALSATVGLVASRLG